MTVAGEGGGDYFSLVPDDFSLNWRQYVGLEWRPWAVGPVGG